jgi:hypothetical protein
MFFIFALSQSAEENDQKLLAFDLIHELLEADDSEGSSSPDSPTTPDLSLSQPGISEGTEESQSTPMDTATGVGSKQGSDPGLSTPLLAAIVIAGIMLVAVIGTLIGYSVVGKSKTENSNSPMSASSYDPEKEVV